MPHPPLKNFVHTPVRDGSCEGCHDPHGSDYRFILSADPVQNLCSECHAKDAFMAAAHLHSPVATGACILCHESHSSWNPSSSYARGGSCARSATKTWTDRWRRCATCTSRSPRGARRAMTSMGRITAPPFPEPVGALPRLPRGHGCSLEDQLHVHGAVSTEETCANCHAGHASDLPRLLKAPLMDSCLVCHNKQILLDDGRTVLDMGALLRDNPDYHGPVRRADCSACHNPHASPNFDF